MGLNNFQLMYKFQYAYRLYNFTFKTWLELDFKRNIKYTRPYSPTKSGIENSLITILYELVLLTRSYSHGPIRGEGNLQLATGLFIF